jgi:hypothetical protein
MKLITDNYNCNYCHDTGLRLILDQHWLWKYPHAIKCNPVVCTQCPGNKKNPMQKNEYKIKESRSYTGSDGEKKTVTETQQGSYINWAQSIEGREKKGMILDADPICNDQIFITPIQELKLKDQIYKLKYVGKTEFEIEELRNIMINLEILKPKCF